MKQGRIRTMAVTAMLAGALAMSAAAQAQGRHGGNRGGGQPVGQTGMSTLCKFNNGPSAGRTQDFRLIGLGPVPVGTSCYSNDGSTGFVIPGRGGERPYDVDEEPGPYPPRWSGR